MPRGGTNSTMVMNLPSAISEPRRERCANGAGGVSLLDCRRGVCSLPRAPAHPSPEWPAAWRECDSAWCRSSRPPSALLRRSPCAQSWPYIRASTGRCSAPRPREACRRWAWRASGRCRRRAHLLNRRQHRRRAGRAVHSHGVGAPLGQPRGRLRRRRTVQALALIVHRHHHQHRKLRGHRLRRFQRLARLIQGGHRLHNQQVDATSLEHADLLGKGRAGFIQAGFAQRFQPHAQWSHCAGHPCFASLFLFKALHCLTRQANSRRIDLFHLCAQPVPGQPKAVGTESVGFKNLRPGKQVFFVDGNDQIGVRQVQFVVAAVGEHTASFSTVPMAPSASTARSEKISANRLILLSCYRIASRDVSTVCAPRLTFARPTGHAR